MIKILILFLFLGNTSLAIGGEKHRGQLVKVLSATIIQVKELKKPITINLRGVSDKKLTKDQKNKAIKYLKEKLTGQVLIWENFKDGSELSPSGIGLISHILLEQGLVNLDTNSPESYKKYEELARNRKIGIWGKK